MRPAGEIRMAVAEATRTLVSDELPGVTWRQVAEHARVGHDVARRTMENMARGDAGDLVRVGTVSVPGARRPMTLYAPREAAAADVQDDDTVPPLLLLDDVLRGWLPGSPGG